MTISEIVTAVVLHLIIPGIGLFLYLKLSKNIKIKKLENSPEKELFVIFATYGALLVIILTELFWKWSGMASLGAFYLILGAPIAMGIIAWRMRKVRNNSKYHKWTFYSAILYYLVAPAMLGLILMDK